VNLFLIVPWKEPEEFQGLKPVFNRIKTNPGGKIITPLLQAIAVLHNSSSVSYRIYFREQ
jgi:hypothetical protein